MKLFRCTFRLPYKQHQGEITVMARDIVEAVGAAMEQHIKPRWITTYSDPGIQADNADSLADQVMNRWDDHEPRPLEDSLSIITDWLFGREWIELDLTNPLVLTCHLGDCC